MINYLPKLSNYIKIESHLIKKERAYLEDDGILCLPEYRKFIIRLHMNSTGYNSHVPDQGMASDEAGWITPVDAGAPAPEN